ncbi:MAG: hypothetical protein IT203_06850 [Fimbriimonadaceae bacterium]|nr:hypothetical protein [Fimbriimonadaceae bacterium]
MGTETDDVGTLRIERSSPKDIRMRDLYVLVDDDTEDNLLYGEFLELELPVGEHRIKITNRLFTKSETMTVSAGETVRYRVANIPATGPMAILMLITGSGSYKVHMERR